MAESDSPVLQRLIRRIQEATRARLGAEQVQAVLQDILRIRDDWLDPAYQDVRGRESASYPLHEEPDGSFCMVGVVIGPDVTLAVHDHGGWAVLGVYKGRIRETWFQRLDDGSTPGRAKLAVERTFIHDRGAVGVLPEGQIHTATGLGDAPAVTIQIYGTTLDKQGRTTFDMAAGTSEPYRPHYIDVHPGQAGQSLQRKVMENLRGTSGFVRRIR